jgi:hypothetical protein
MKDNVLKQHSSSIDPKTWHIASLESYTYLNMSQMSTSKLDINSRMHIKWLHFLPSFFKISEALWSMVILNKKA